MDNLRKLATYGIQDEEKENTRHNMCWAIPCANKHKLRN